jgi:hypothetical protein
VKSLRKASIRASPSPPPKYLTNASLVPSDVGARPLGDAPELGPTADVITIYEAVARMRPVPMSKRSLIPIIAAAVLPTLPVFAMEVTVKELLKSLAGALL